MEKFYRCSCYSEVLAVEQVEEYREIEFCIYASSGNTLRDRLRHLWRILRYGKPYGDQIVLDNDTASALTRDLIEMLRVSKAMQVWSELDLLSFTAEIRDMASLAYRGFQDMKFKIVKDDDRPEERRLRCTVDVTGEPEEILADEDAFYDMFFELIPEDRQDLISVSYHGIEKGVANAAEGKQVSSAHV